MLKSITNKITAKLRGQTLDSLIQESIDRLTYWPVPCPICHLFGVKTFMVFRRSHIVEKKNIPVRDDIALKCPVCYHTLHQGAPMTRKDAKKTIKARGSAWLMTPTYNPKEQHDKNVKARLKALGYGY